MKWLSRNAPSIEACSALVTASVAIAALIGVKVQLDETERLQKAQSAREAFRAHLALAATLPQFARPKDSCALVASTQGGSYIAFVDHLLYSAEQMLVVGEGWDATFLIELAPHKGYLCSEPAPIGATDETASLLNDFRQNNCTDQPAC